MLIWCASDSRVVIGIFDFQKLASLLGNPPQGNQEPLVVRDKVGRPSAELGSMQASPWNVIFSLQCSDTVGWATGRASDL